MTRNQKSKRRRDSSSDSEYDISSFGNSASCFAQYEENALNIKIIETDTIKDVFPTYLGSSVGTDLEHLRLEEFDYDRIVTFVPTQHRDLGEHQRRFLLKLKHVLQNDAADTSESGAESYVRVMVDVFLDECKLDDALELEIVPSRLKMKICDEHFFAHTDREGRKNETLVWVLQVTKHKNDIRYNNGDIQLVAGLIAACQHNYNIGNGKINPRVLYGINIKSDRISIMRTTFSEEYISSLFRGLPQQQLEVLKYPKDRGLKLSDPIERSQVLNLVTELRRHALSIDTSL